MLTWLLAADQPRGSGSSLLLRAAAREGGLRAVHGRQTGLLAAAGLRDPLPRLCSQVRHATLHLHRYLPPSSFLQLI